MMSILVVTVIIILTSSIDFQLKAGRSRRSGRGAAQADC